MSASSQISFVSRHSKLFFQSANFICLLTKAKVAFVEPKRKYLSVKY